MPETYFILPLTQGKFALVDEADRELISRFKWFARICVNGVRRFLGVYKNAEDAGTVYLFAREGIYAL